MTRNFSYFFINISYVFKKIPNILSLQSTVFTRKTKPSICIFSCCLIKRGLPSLSAIKKALVFISQAYYTKISILFHFFKFFLNQSVLVIFYALRNIFFSCLSGNENAIRHIATGISIKTKKLISWNITPTKTASRNTRKINTSPGFAVSDFAAIMPQKSQRPETEKSSAHRTKQPLIYHQREIKTYPTPQFSILSLKSHCSISYT